MSKVPHCRNTRLVAHILMSPCLAGVHARNQEFYSGGGGGGGPGPTAGKQSGQRFFFFFFFFFIALNLFYS